MVDKRRTIAVLVALLVIAAGLWWLLRAKSPEEQIKAQLAKLCELVSKKANEKGTQIPIKSFSLQGIFADPVEISGDAGPVAGLHTPDELTSLIIRGRTSMKTIDLTFTDLSVEIQSPEKAAISFTAKLQVTMKHGDGMGDNYRQVSGKLVKVDGKWVFSNFKVVNVMKGQ